MRWLRSVHWDYKGADGRVCHSAERALFRADGPSTRARAQASDAELRNLFKLIDTDCNGVGAGHETPRSFSEMHTLIFEDTRALVLRHSAASTPSIVRSRSDVQLVHLMLPFRRMRLRAATSQSVGRTWFRASAALGRDDR